MKLRFSKEFIKKYKKANVRIRNRVDQQLQKFETNPNELGLRNHQLHGEWAGYKSIDITEDYRAIYKDVHEEKETNAYFIDLGTHKELYG